MRNKRCIVICTLFFMLILLCVVFTNVGTAHATTMASYIDTSGSKPVMMVDNIPFFYNGIQYSLPRVMDRDGWNWSQMEQIFSAAHDSNYTVFGVPIMWNHIEPVKDTFDWTDIEKTIDYGYKYGLKIEILWFGSQVCTASNIGTGTPQYVVNDYQKVLKSGGTPIYSYGLDDITKQYTYTYKVDITDPNLLLREKYVLTQLMNHIKTYQDSHGYGNIIVGIEILNEPTSAYLWNAGEPGGSGQTDRSYSNYANTLWTDGGYSNVMYFNADIMYNYLKGLAQAVKTSDYSIWTRVNFYTGTPGEGDDFLQRIVNANESDRASGSSFIDFLGRSLYSDSYDGVYNYVTGPLATGKNLVSVMENSATYTNGGQLMFNALAGNGNYHVWELNYTIGDPQYSKGLYVSVKRGQTSFK